MREIKFRFWDGDGKRMLPVSSLEIGNKFLVARYDGIERYGVLVSHKKANAVLMQFTGLLDRNGKEIYEGDILKLKADDGEELRQEWEGAVEFGNPNGEYSWGWQLKPLKNAKVNPDILLWVETELLNVSCEVIGNIYENGDLLK